ncbi:MAG: amidohydrolase family protein, partial [Pontibacterium sp.]
LCSDHQPHNAAAKEAPFAATEPGMSGLETLLPLSLMLVEQGLLDMDQVIEKLTSAPASILGLEQGTLKLGSDADICIFDPSATWTLTPETSFSKGKNTPFMNSELKGRVSYTLVAGSIVYRAQ